jgi:hypothetical protein
MTCRKMLARLAFHLRFESNLGCVLPDFKPSKTSRAFSLSVVEH